MTRATMPTIRTIMLVVSIATTATRGASFRLTTADLARRDVQVKAMTATDLTVVDVATKSEQTMPIASVVELRRPPTKRSADGWFALCTRDGQRIVCKPTAISDDAVVCATQRLGTRTFPIASVESLAVATLPDEAGQAAQQDELRLANGDRVRGIVSGADVRSVTCQASDGQVVPIEWTNVRRIRFAETQAAVASAARFRVTLAGDTRVRVTAFATDGTNAMLSTSDGDVRVPIDDVVSIEHVDGGDALMLAWVEPTVAQYEPFFPATITEPKAFAVDAIATGKFEATTALRVRPKTTLRWSVASSVRRFRGRCVVPAGRAFADVTVRVLDGTRIAFEEKDVKSGGPPLEIDVPLSSGKAVTIETDYGETFDVQDQAIWLDARLLASPTTDRK